MVRRLPELDPAQFYRREAHRLHAAAHAFSSPEARAQLAAVARQYERLAAAADLRTGSKRRDYANQNFALPDAEAISA